MPNRGGSHEQHVKAGQQSHKNDDGKQMASSKAKMNNDKERSGKGNSADDRERASEAGRKDSKH